MSKVQQHLSHTPKKTTRWVNPVCRSLTSSVNVILLILGVISPLWIFSWRESGAFIPRIVRKRNRLSLGLEILFINIQVCMASCWLSLHFVRQRRLSTFESLSQSHCTLRGNCVPSDFNKNDYNNHAKLTFENISFSTGWLVWRSQWRAAQ